MFSFFSKIFGGRSTSSGSEVFDQYGPRDPNTGYREIWDDERRLRFCQERMDTLLGDMGGTPRRTADAFRIYTHCEEQPVRIALDWSTGSVEISAMGQNNLGLFSVHRDIPDEEKPAEVLTPTDDISGAQWELEEKESYMKPHYVGDSVYLECVPEDFEFEVKRWELLPAEIRNDILFKMQKSNLYWLYAHEDSVDFNFDELAFRAPDFTSAVSDSIPLVVRTLKACTAITDPDPGANHDANPLRCDFCGSRIVASEQQRCSECGASR